MRQLNSFKNDEVFDMLRDAIMNVKAPTKLVIF